jgi:transcriptional regulator of acetoin/glycerol metabolism
VSLDEVRKAHIQKVLQMCNGNRLRAAQILGIGRTSLYRYLKRDGCEARPRAQSNIATA